MVKAKVSMAKREFRKLFQHLKESGGYTNKDEMVDAMRADGLELSFGSLSQWTSMSSTRMPLIDVVDWMLEQSDYSQAAKKEFLRLYIQDILNNSNQGFLWEYVWPSLSNKELDKLVEVKRDHHHENF